MAAGPCPGDPRLCYVGKEDVDAPATIYDFGFDTTEARRIIGWAAGIIRQRAVFQIPGLTFSVFHK